MQQPLDTFFQYVYGFFNILSDMLQPLGIPLGPGDWFFLIYTIVFVAIIAAIARRGGSGKSDVSAGVTRIIASTGDVSAGMTGTKKLSFLKTPGDALVFLRVEENAVQQAITAVEYYAQQGELDDSMKDLLIAVYQTRLDGVRAAMAKDEELKEIVDTDAAMDRARSDYLRKLAAMSGTAVESDEEQAGPPSVGMPDSAETTTTTVAASTPDTAPSGGPPGGTTPSGGPPGGAAPSGGPPGGARPSGGPPAGGPPNGAAPSSGPPGGAAPSGSPSAGETTPSGPPGGAAPSGGPPGGAAPGGGAPSSGPPGGAAPSGSPSPGGATGKSSLQSEMLAEMERLKALMSGD